MRVSDLIEHIDDWQTKTIDEVWAELNANTKQFVSDQWWSLLGIAQVIGEANVSPFIAYLKSINLEWVATQAAGRGIPIGDPAINNILRNNKTNSVEPHPIFVESLLFSVCPSRYVCAFSRTTSVSMTIRPM